MKATLTRPRTILIEDSEYHPEPFEIELDYIIKGNNPKILAMADAIDNEIIGLLINSINFTPTKQI